MISSKTETVDAVGKWFQVYRELQEPYQIGFELITENNTELISISHIEHDGIGAVRTICTTRNLTCRLINSGKSFKKPNRFELLFSAFKFLWITRPRKAPWPLDIEKSSTDLMNRLFMEFSIEETSKLKSAALHKRISLNSLLFFEFNRSLTDIFEIKSGAWWVPVNMRTELSISPNDTTRNENLVSNFTIDYENETDAIQIHQKIKNCLQQKRHWGTWWWQLLADKLSKSLIIQMAKIGLKNHYIGAFSNIGEWTCPDPNVLLIPFINTLKSHPLGAGVIIWNGKLCISLRFYDGLKITELQKSNLKQCLYNRLQSYLKT